MLQPYIFSRKKLTVFKYIYSIFDILGQGVITLTQKRFKVERGNGTLYIQIVQKRRQILGHQVKTEAFLTSVKSQMESSSRAYLFERSIERSNLKILAKIYVPSVPTHVWRH